MSKETNPYTVFNRKFLKLQNVVGVLLSVPVLFTGFWLANKNKTDCATFLQTPIVVIGVLLLVVSLVGFIAACSPLQVVDWLLLLHLLLLFLLVILLFCFSIFALEITNQAGGHKVSGQKYREYQLKDYPKWMRRRVENPTYWSKVKKCLQRSTNVCGPGVLPAFGTDSQTYLIDVEKLNPVQLGCCKPPSACNFTYLGVSSRPFVTTVRGKPRDCNKWSVLPNQLCYDCDSCKAGEIQLSMDHWRTAGIVYVALVICMIILYAFFACYAFEAN